MERKVAIADLKPGMYVSRLDRPWIETPFLFQGFEIKGEEEIQQLSDLCKYVYIDEELGAPVDRYVKRSPDGPVTQPPAKGTSAKPAKVDASPEPKRRPKSRPTAVPAAYPASRNVIVYEDTVSVEEEVSVAKEIHRDVSVMVHSMLDEIRAGSRLNAGDLAQNLDLMVESILRNPNAFMWLMSLKGKDSYAYSHSINTCVLATAFGRHLGLDKHTLKVLAMGALLFDVGKAKLPEELLNKPARLSAEEFALAQKHVDYGLEVLEQTRGIGKDVITMVECHHERFNGNGYPHGLKGKEIPVPARIAAIVDCYDSMISDRPYKKAISPHAAVNAIYRLKNVAFEEELISHFMEFIGVYPTGTLVELSTGEVGMVIAQDRIRRLQPKVMLILDRNKHAYDFRPVLDLMRDAENAAGGQTVQIVRALDPGSYGIDPAKLEV